MAAQIQINTQQTKPRSNTCFLISCFGVSRKVEEPEKKFVQSNDNSKKDIGLLCWSKFRMKKSGIKTVPIIDPTTEQSADHHQSDTKLDTSKSKLKWLSYRLLINKRQKPIINKKSFDEIPTVPKEIVEGTTAKEPEQNISIFENRKSLEKRLSFLRRSEARRTGSSQPGSPDVKTKPIRKSPLSHSVSLPAPNPPSQNRVKLKRPQPNNNVTAKKIDPLVGMSFIIVILIITFIWGRLCAILCTSAWFYFISSLRSATKHNEDTSNSGDLDLNSEEHKKKVVLEGFLERNHRANAL